MLFSKAPSRGRRPLRCALLLVAASAAVSGPTAGWAAEPSQPPTNGVAQLLSERGGYGGQVTGGAAGPVVHVTTAAEQGPGSLRAAVAGDAPRWVVFDGDYSIRLTSGLRVGRNKTIDGRGRNVTISGPRTDGLLLVDTSNVIVNDLTMRDFGDVTRTDQNDTPDAIHLERARGVWLHRLRLSHAGDKLIAISGGSDAITVDRSHFFDQEQVFQIGNQATADSLAPPTVTIDHNFFDRTGYRNPVVSYGRAHIYNNYFLDWKNYAVRSQRDAQVYLENNVFVGGRSQKAAVTTAVGDGCNDAHTRCDTRPGLLVAVGNSVQNAKISQERPSLVFRPSAAYRYTPSSADAVLVRSLLATVGPASARSVLSSRSR